MKAEKKLERVSCRKGPCKISSDLVGKRMALGSWRTQSGCFFALLHVLCCHRAVSHWKTHLLVFGAPKARRNWREAMAELIRTGFSLRNCSRLHQRTQPHWEKGQILLWQDHECTSRCNSVHNSNLEAGGPFLLFWQARPD